MPADMSSGMADTFCRHPFAPAQRTLKRTESCRCSKQCYPADQTQRRSDRTISLSRRQLAAAPLLGGALLALASPPAQAVQGLTAGRIPGLSKGVDEEGFRTYRRPDGKSGGHGVGWSEIPPYTFKVPEGWREVPVSIADLGGTEIDLRFGSEKDGNMAIVVAPVLRFLDVGFNSDVRIQELGSPEKLISGFGPELFGSPLQDGDVLDTQVTEKDGLKFYNWELKPHRLVAATAYKNRVFLMALEANSRQWRKSQPMLRKIQESFCLAGLQA